MSACSPSLYIRRFSSMATETFDYDNAPTIFDPATLIQKGRCVVSKTRTPTQHELYYEMHGTREDINSQGPPPRRMVFIMGLSNSCFGWDSQVKHFARLAQGDSLGPCQVLVFDNRGVGLSDAPKGAYTTSEMARDTVELLEFVGWIPEQEKRLGQTGDDVQGITVIGVSMGGMIALELVSEGHPGSKRICR